MCTSSATSSAIPRYLWLATGGGYNPIANTYALTYNRTNGPAIKIEVPAEGRAALSKNVFMTDDMYMGLPMIAVAMKTLEIAATADDQALQDVAKGGKHKVLIQEQQSTPTAGTRGRANRQELKNMTQQFSEQWMANDVMMLDNVADAKIISQTSQQLQLLQRGFEVSEIAQNSLAFLAS